MGTLTTDVEAPAPPDDTPDDGAAPTSASPRRRFRRVLFGQRKAGYQVHKWLSLVLMAWIVLESVTGAALVFAPEIDRWWNSEAHRVTDGDVGMDAAIDAARDARPGEPVDSAWAPGGLGPTYSIVTVDDGGVFRLVLVDPGSGRVTTADHEEPALTRMMERLHFKLNSTEILGFASTTIVGWLALAWLVILVTGFTVWYWPRIKRWARALRVRHGRGRLIFNVDLHNAIGIATILPLTLIVLTGVAFMFPNQVRETYEVATFGLYEEPDTTAALSTPNGGEPITAGEATERVVALDDGIDVQLVETPSGSPVGVYRVHTVVDGSYLELVGGARDVEFEVDQYSGRIVRISDPADGNGATRAYADWTYPVHIGTFGGTITRWLWVAIGLSPLALAWTGVVMWWVRHRNRRRGALDDTAPEPSVQSDEKTLEQV